MQRYAVRQSLSGTPARTSARWSACRQGAGAISIEFSVLRFRVGLRVVSAKRRFTSPSSVKLVVGTLVAAVCWGLDGSHRSRERQSADAGAARTLGCCSEVCPRSCAPQSSPCLTWMWVPAVPSCCVAMASPSPRPTERPRQEKLEQCAHAFEREDTHGCRLVACARVAWQRSQV